MPCGSKGLGPERPSDPSSEGLNILPRAGVSARFLLPQDYHRTRPGCERRREGLGALLSGSAVDFENAVVEHRRCRLQRSSWNQVNGALRADDIVHETEGMRSNATAAYPRTPCLRDPRVRHGEKILIVEDSLPVGRNDRRFAARLRPRAGRSGRQGGARKSTGPRPRDRRRGFVPRSAPGEKSHPELSLRQNGLPTTIAREERFAADVRLRCSHRAWKDTRRTPQPRPAPGRGRRSG
jgi:hypothetical protein